MPICAECLGPLPYTSLRRSGQRERGYGNVVEGLELYCEGVCACGFVRRTTENSIEIPSNYSIDES